MFCPKCGTENPNNGKFCRSCGQDLVAVSAAVTGQLKLKKGEKCDEPATIDNALTKMGTGLAFLIIAAFLGYTGMIGARVWWFWLLIPAFTMMGGGIAVYLRYRKQEAAAASLSMSQPQNAFGLNNMGELPPVQTDYISPESRFRTGDLVPPSVAEGTTRHLEINREGETMTLQQERQKHDR